MDSVNKPSTSENVRESGEPLRRSQRGNLGQAPDRYGTPIYPHSSTIYEDRSLTPSDERNDVELVSGGSALRQRQNASYKEVRSADVVSTRTTRSTKSMQKRVQADLRLAEILQAQELEKIARERAREAEFDRREFEAKKKTAKMINEIEKAQIDDEDNLSQCLSDEDADGIEENFIENQQQRRREYCEDNNSEFSIPYRRCTPELPKEHEQIKVQNIRRRDDEPKEEKHAKMEDVLKTMAATMEAIAKVTIDKKDDSSSTKSIPRFLARQTVSKELPHFHGDPEEWPTFIAEYERSTKLCEFSDVENISRLQKCLKSKAREAVKSLLTVPENVGMIIKTLKLNFGRPDLIVESILEKLKKWQSVKEGRYDMLLEFSNAVMNTVTTMKGLNSVGHLNNPQLMKELGLKLPPNLQLQWVLTRAKEVEPNLECFANWLFETANASTYFCSLKPPAEREPEKKQKTSRIFTTEQKKSTTGDPASKVLQCLCCSRPGHNLYNCFKFTRMNSEARWEFVRESSVCFQCLIPGHRFMDCKASACGQDGCRRKHHKLLHKKQFNPNARDQGSEVKEKAVLVCGSTIMKKTLLVILPVTVVGPKGEFKTFCLLDTGAEDSFMESSVATKVGLTGPRKPIRLMGPGIGQPCVESDSRQVSCGLKGDHGNKTYRLNSVSTVRNLNLPRQTVDVNKLYEDWPHLKYLPLSSYTNAKPTILIGQDNSHLLSYENKVSNTKGGPIAIETLLGWAVHGKTTSGGASCEDMYVCNIRKEDEDLHQLVKDSFLTESFGVKIVKEPKRSVQDSRADRMMKEYSRQVTSLDSLKTSLDDWMNVDESPDLSKYNTARWVTCLPWKEEMVQLPESYSMALRRLKSVEKKMDKSDEFAKEYIDKIQTYINKGFARKLDHKEAQIVGPKTWYLPHFDVVNPNKPKKFRLVFDAAAKSNGKSLNDSLIQGPDLLNPLANILMQFREKKIGFTADIRDMFHRVWIQPKDSCAQRFLWRGMDRTKPPDVYEMQVMVFGAVSSPYCAHFIKNMNAERFREEFPAAVTGIVKKHYVDDYLDCADSEEEAIKLIEDVRMIHRKGGFEIIGWTSSSKEVLKKIPVDIQATGQKDLEPESSLPMARVLGLYWDPNDDVFTFSCNFVKVNEDIVSGGKIPTKREMLKLVMSVFDPLGFLSHFTVKAKILLQEVWRTSADWDDEVSEKIFIKWCSWLQELKRIPNLKIQRCYSFMIPQAKNIQLHLFCDASLLSFAAVAYLRVEYEGGVDVSFVMARTRVAPLKSMTLPRLELQGAVMAVRLARSIQDGLQIKIDNLHFWTDNSCVLGWIRADSRRFVTFVANRVGEIQEDSDVSSWHWVPTADNVADDATRDKDICDFSPSSRWVNGPSYLKLQPEDWPKENFKLNCDQDDSELKKVNVVWTSVSTESLPEVSRFSSWLKLIRSTAWLIRFINKIRKKAPTNTEGWESWRAPVIQCLGGQVLRRSLRHEAQSPERKTLIELQPEEYLYAEKLWIRQSQWDSFPAEMDALSKNRPIEKSSRLKNLSPYLENGIMKLYGRLEKCKSIELDTKRPAVLDPKHPFTILLIKFYHDQAKHIGQETVVNELRQKYWILNARAAVKASWNSCNICKINRVKPIIQEMGDLPEFRLERAQRPFTFTGLDYFGPMEVTVGRRHEKRYGALFTCLSTRAVHLELANSLDTDSVIMALTRFIGRRGSPRKIYSDNGTNFHGANNELKKCLAAIDSESIRKKFGQNGLKWIFNPPSAPHMGGAWERLVQSVKVALSNMLKSKFPKEEILVTTLVECERIINSRPITHVSVDPDDPEGLTPNHFLIGSSNGEPPFGELTMEDNPRKRWKHCQVLADHFWKRWVREYLPTLARRTKWNKPGANLKVGDLVFIADGDFPRCQWPRGKVVAVFPGTDGKVRVADVKTSSGLYRRPVVKLCPLDVQNFVVNASPDTSTAGSMLPSSVK